MQTTKCILTLTGGNVWCLDIWGEDSSPYFQALHFLFGLGAFGAPLIAEPFLAQQEGSEYSLSNISTHVDNHNETNLYNSSYFESLPPITYAYGIIGIFALFVTLLFTVLFCVSVKEESINKSELPGNNKGPNTCISIIVVLLSSLLLSVYAGIEIGYGQMIATFAVKSDLHLSKATASLITSVYWGTFTFSRGISIILAAKLSPISLIITDFVLMVLASAILLFLGNVYVEFLWIGTAVLGLALASFYPTTITWIERHVNVCNKIASSFVVAASLGEMIVPLTISQFVDTNPKILLYIVIYSVAACGVLIFILWLILKRIGSRYIVEQVVPNHLDENESSGLNTQNDVDESSL